MIRHAAATTKIATKPVRDTLTGQWINAPAHMVASERTRGDMRDWMERKGYVK